jgi:hypothetical protein
MKTFTFAIILSSLLHLSVKSQTVRCQELLDFVVENGNYKGEVSSLSLINSSWLKSVKAYQYKNSIFIVAEISTDDFGFSSKQYIFCGIPLRNWENFSNGLVDFDLGYGKKFHKYIIDYKCDCR